MHTGAENLTHPAAELDAGSAKDTAAYVAIVAAADLTRVPPDATSLRAWLDAARTAMA